MNEKRKTVSLVLGSGGARGLAHIGVIHVLEERGYDIQSVSGCSVGALVGGIYAAGKLAEYEEWVRKLTKFDMVNLMDIAWVGGGLVKGEKIMRRMRDLVGERQIEDLPIPFTAVATELESGREVWLNEGSLFDAIRSSCSLPLFFTPTKYREKMLVDGGVVNPVPVSMCRAVSLPPASMSLPSGNMKSHSGGTQTDVWLSQTSLVPQSESSVQVSAGE